SAALLHFTLRAAPIGLVVFTAARIVELEDNRAARRLVRTLAQMGTLHRIEMAPLDAEDTARLARDVAPALDAGEIYARSHGNPLFTIELARAGKAIRGALPSTLTEVIEGRLSQPTAPARTLIPWVASLGHDIRLDALERITEMPSADLLAALEELE